MGWLMKEFYGTVGWDPNTGGSTAEKMQELGIAELCNKIINPKDPADPVNPV